MKSIQLSGATMSRSAAPESAAVGNRSALPQESFHLSWPHRSDGTEPDVDGKPSRALVTQVPAKCEQLKGGMQAPNPRSLSHAELVLRAQRATAPAGTSISTSTKVRPQHISSLLSESSGSGKLKHKGGSVHSSGPDETVGSAKETPGTNVDGCIASTSPDGNAHPQHQIQPLQNSGKTDHLEVDRAQVNIHPGSEAASPTGKGDSMQHVSDSKEKPASPVTRVKDEVSSLPNAEGLLSISNGLRTGSPGSEIVPVSPQLIHAGSGSHRVAGQLTTSHNATAVPAGIPQTISSTPVRLDVGVLNGTHGWLRIRAELGTGGAVNTSVTAIDAAHEALRTAVPEIVSYLGHEDVKVNRIEVLRFTDGGGPQSGMGSETPPNGEQQRNESADSIPGQSFVSTPGGGMDDGEDVSEANGQVAPQLVGSVSGGGVVNDVTSSVPGMMWRSGLAGNGAWLNVCA
jgi:hypothetical protein